MSSSKLTIKDYIREFIQKNFHQDNKSEDSNNLSKSIENVVRKERSRANDQDECASPKDFTFTKVLAGPKEKGVKHSKKRSEKATTLSDDSASTSSSSRKRQIFNSESDDSNYLKIEKAKKVMKYDFSKADLDSTQDEIKEFRALLGENKNGFWELRMSDELFGKQRFFSIRTWEKDEKGKEKTLKGFNFEERFFSSLLAAMECCKKEMKIK